MVWALECNVSNVGAVARHDLAFLGLVSVIIKGVV